MEKKGDKQRSRDAELGERKRERERERDKEEGGALGRFVGVLLV